MESLTLPEFWERYRLLPPQVKAQARKAYQLLRRNPAHPSLRFKRLKAYTDLWPVRVSRGYRAVGARGENRILWFWIGSHADFDREFPLK